MMKRVGAPSLSPDGKWVVYSVLEPSYETDKSVSDLWLVAADGLKAPRRITNTKAAEGDVVWSPDSSSIAFTTKRETDDADQIYILNLAEGGEARRLTNISTGASSPKWRPDGKAILFESLVYPNTTDDEGNKKIAADRKAHKYNVRTYEHFPIRFWNQWLDDRQPTLMVQSIEPGSAPQSESARATCILAFFARRNSRHRRPRWRDALSLHPHFIRQRVEVGWTRSPGYDSDVAPRSHELARPTSPHIGLRRVLVAVADTPEPLPALSRRKSGMTELAAGLPIHDGAVVRERIGGQRI